jgi:hypothetical protein
MPDRYVLHLTLVPADRDGPPFSPRCQQDITCFYNQARAGGNVLDATGFVLGTGRGDGGFTGSFVLPLAQLNVPGLVGAASTWLDGRAGRSITLRLRDIGLHARTRHDLDRLLAQLLTLPPVDVSSELRHG